VVGYGQDDSLLLGTQYVKLGLSFTRGGSRMINTYTAKYTKIESGYMGQLVEWPEVITEGETLEECREMLQDALQEMIKAYRQQQKEVPTGRALLEQMPVEV
jgi:predicted RNase H-like HicB family nuclease